jgi:hypothetical protein
MVPAQQIAGVGLPPQQLHQPQPAVQFPVQQQQQQSAPTLPRKKRALAIVDPETHETINKEQLQEAAKEKDASDAAAVETPATSTPTQSVPMRGGPERGEHRREGTSSTPLNEEEKKAVDIRQKFAQQITNKCYGRNTPDVGEEKEEVPVARTVPPPSSVPPTDGGSIEQAIDVQRQTCSVPPPERTGWSAKKWGS